jgi:alkaline phosphatase
VSHATPAAAYAHNVGRSDYQDLAKDLLGLRSVSHPEDPLAGVDVLIGCGFGVEARADAGQGRNFVAGNRYVADADVRAIDVSRSGRYVVSTRTPGASGAEKLHADADRAAASGKRLFGFFGVKDGGGHLPFRTADGGYDPVRERYSAADLRENPTLADMTAAALAVLERDADGFWLMIEAGDVDWASHDADLDAAVGAVLSGDAAVRVVTDWVERRSNWSESLLVVTSDHGHYLVLTRPDGLADADNP